MTKMLLKAAIVTNPSVGGNGFITYQGTPLGIPHQGLQTEAYLCAQLSTGAQRCHTAPVTTPLACLKRQDDIYKSYPKQRYFVLSLRWVNGDVLIFIL